MYKVGIAGATGYTGLELMRLIQRHPQLEVGWLTSESSAGDTFADVHAVPWDQPLIPLAEAVERADEVDVVFLCLPHAASIEPVRAFVEAGVRVIDLSADYRLKDVATYERWYGVPHTAPELLDSFVYGLCEIYREQLRGAQQIAVPGCYPTTVNLGLYPLAKAGWLGERVIVNSLSGISGAGRKTNIQNLFVEASENATPYNVGARHRHIAEMEMVLNHVNGHRPHRFFFTPHLVPARRGMLSTIFVDVADGVTQADIRAAYAETYANEPFIHLLPAGQQATMQHTSGSNRVAIAVTTADPARPDGTEYIVTSSADNLLKGASGQALQNFNIAAGLEETMGLL